MRALALVGALVALLTFLQHSWAQKVPAAHLAQPPQLLHPPQLCRNASNLVVRGRRPAALVTLWSKRSVLQLVRRGREWRRRSCARRGRDDVRGRILCRRRFTGRSRGRGSGEGESREEIIPLIHPSFARCRCLCVQLSVSHLIYTPSSILASSALLSPSTASQRFIAPSYPSTNRRMASACNSLLCLGA